MQRKFFAEIDWFLDIFEHSNFWINYSSTNIFYDNLNKWHY